MLRGQRGLRLQKGVDLLLEAEVRPKLQIRQRQVGHRRGLVRFEPALDRGALVGEVVVSAHGVKHEVLRVRTHTTARARQSQRSARSGKGEAEEATGKGRERWGLTRRRVSDDA